MNVRKEKTRFGLTNVGSNDHVSAAKRVSEYKVKDLIHSTQEADKKLLGITTETGGGKLFREGRWRAVLEDYRFYDLAGKTGKNKRFNARYGA